MRTEPVVPCPICGTPFKAGKNKRSKTGRTQYCSRPCYKSRPWDPEWFWKKVNKTDSCWLWTGPVNHGGYGVYTVKGRGAVLTHRLSWELINGPIPEGMFVCHNCPGGDVTSCCRPSHCFLGTADDNSKDAMKKGTIPKGPKHCFYGKHWKVVNGRRVWPTPIT